MPRSKALLASAVSLTLATWTLTAAAQTDGAPVPEEPAPPDAALPSEPPPDAPPPAAPTPAEPTPPPSAEPPPAPPAAAPPSGSPPTGEFPLSPSAAPASKKPLRRGSSPPAASFDEPAPAHPAAPLPADSAPAPKPSEGLFQVPPADNHPHQDDEKDERTDQFKIGPVAGIGIPSVVSFGGTLKLTRFLGAGVNIGLIPKVKLSYYGDATLSYQHYDIYGRLYPFGGGFFLSGGAGYATVDGTLSSSQTVAVSGFSGTVDYNGKGTVRTLMLTALVGYFYTTSIGFSFGVDAGAQIPIAPSTISYARTYSVKATVPGALGQFVTQAQADAAAQKQADPIVNKTDQSVRDTLEKIGRSTLPTINLRIGWIL